MLKTQEVKINDLWHPLKNHQRWKKKNKTRKITNHSKDKDWPLTDRC